MQWNCLRKSLIFMAYLKFAKPLRLGSAEWVFCRAARTLPHIWAAPFFRQSNLERKRAQSKWAPDLDRRAPTRTDLPLSKITVNLRFSNG
jgi:hypothetical protein